MNLRRLTRLASSGLAVCVAAATGAAVVEGRSGTNNISTTTANSQSRWSLHSIVNLLEKAFDSILTVHADSSVDVTKTTPWDWNWDDLHELVEEQSGTGSGDSKPKRKICSRHLIFIRHGQYHYADSDENCHLTQLGREQLNLTGMRLKHLNFPYTLIRYSSMTRAIESTEEVLKYLPDVMAVPTDLLREGAPYPLEPPLSYYKPTLKDLQRDNERIESAFRSFVHRASDTQTEDTYEIYICHANVIRYMVCRALQFPPEAWIRFTLDHGSITWLVIRPDGRVSLRCLGNSGHMPREKISVQ